MAVTCGHILRGTGPVVAIGKDWPPPVCTTTGSCGWILIDFTGWAEDDKDGTAHWTKQPFLNLAECIFVSQPNELPNVLNSADDTSAPFVWYRHNIAPNVSRCLGYMNR